MDVTLFIQFSNETFKWRLDEMIKCKKTQMWAHGFVFFLCSLVQFLDGCLYTIIKLTWKLIQSRIVPTLVLVEIFGNRNTQQYLDIIQQTCHAKVVILIWHQILVTNLQVNM